MENYVDKSKVYLQEIDKKTAKRIIEKNHYETNNKSVASFVKVTTKATLYVACTDVCCQYSRGY